MNDEILREQNEQDDDILVEEVVVSEDENTENVLEAGPELTEDDWKTAPKRVAPKSKIPKRVDISIDTKVKDVIQYDIEGKNLFFEPDLDRFLKLPGRAVESLSAINRARYFSAYGEYKYQKDNKDAPKIAERIQVSPRYSTATQRLEVNGKDPSMHYCWKRSDELRQAAYEGYVVAEDGDLDTFGSDSGTAHTVGAFGDTELILMKLPKEENEKRQRAIVEKSLAREHALDSTYEREVKSEGGLTYKEPKGVGGPNFTPAVSDENS